MPSIHTTRPGDRLDAIAWATYGADAVTGARALERILAANIGLGPALSEPELAPGLALILPDPPEAKAPAAAARPAAGGAVRLWD